jgi:hypothetical protein
LAAGTSPASVVMEGSSITLAYGYPAASAVNTEPSIEAAGLAADTAAC